MTEDFINGAIAGAIAGYLFMGVYRALDVNRAVIRDYEERGRSIPPFWMQVLAVAVMTVIWPLSYFVEAGE